MEQVRVIKQTKVGRGISELIVSTACIYGEYETLVMKRDYSDIDGGKYGGEREALAAHDTFVAKYTEMARKRAEDATGKHLPIRYTKLSEALRTALSASESALDTEDGGTSNLDSLELRLPRWRAELVAEAARRAGLIAIARESHGGGSYLINHGSKFRQGNARTLFAEKMCAAMCEANYNATVNYHMD